MSLSQTKGYQVVYHWMKEKNCSPFPYQLETWENILCGESGLVNAPTGYGKTYSVFLGAIIRFINEHPDDYQTKKNNKLLLLWITPLRALAKDIGRAMEEVITELGMSWEIAIRNGDTPPAERQRQKRHMPEVLIITPESLHLILAQKDYPGLFSELNMIAVDEWHELLGSKRGVQVELAIARIISLSTRKQVGSCKLRVESSELGDGSSELEDGSLKLEDGSSELGDGSSELGDGGSELGDGSSEFTDNGSKFIVDGFDPLKNSHQEKEEDIYITVPNYELSTNKPIADVRSTYNNYMK